MQQEVFDCLHSEYAKMYSKCLKSPLAASFIFRNFQETLLQFKREELSTFIFKCPIYAKYAAVFTDRRDYADFMQVAVHETVVWLYKNPDKAHLHFTKKDDEGAVTEALMLGINHASINYKASIKEHQQKAADADAVDPLGDNTGLALISKEMGDVEGVEAEFGRRNVTPLFNSRAFIEKKMGSRTVSEESSLGIPSSPVEAVEAVKSPLHETKHRSSKRRPSEVDSIFG